MAFELPTLAYAKTALGAKGMCEETLDLHHGKVKGRAVLIP